MDEVTSKVLQMFFPYAFKKRSIAMSNNTRFVHYTSASAAMQIISKNEIWMRNATCMNDYSEVNYGIDCLCHAYDSDVGKKFKDTLNNCFPGISSEIEALFNSWIHDIRFDSYLTCISEHHDQEDILGRLSMWRAYGKNCGVAFVMNNGPFLRPSDALRAYTSPVAYLDKELSVQYMLEVAENIEREKIFLSNFGRDGVRQTFFEVFKNAALCVKHKGFEEEKEWRIVFTPKLSASSRLIPAVETVSGIPQKIFKIPFSNVPEEGFYGATIPELLDRVIIGPTQYPVAMHQAFVDLLERSGVINAAERVIVSDIPLRV